MGSLNAALSAEMITQFYAAMSDFWHPVALSAALCERTPLPVMLLGESLVLVRLDGNVHALSDFCRHFQARLSSGEVVSVAGHEALQCPYHGWSYNGTGRCVRIPQLSDKQRIPASAAVSSYRVREQFGLLWVSLSNCEPEYGLPEFPEFDDPSFRTVRLLESEPTRASAPRLILATLDDTHFPWVHEGLLGERDHPEPPKHSVWREQHTLRCRYATQQPSSVVSADLSQAGAAGGLESIRYTNTVTMPTTIRLVKDGAAGRYVIWLTASPTSYNVTTNFWAFSRNYDLEPSRDVEYERFSRLVRGQDKPIVESQRPILVPPLNAGIQLPISPGDSPLVEYIRWLDELLITVAPNV